MNYTKHISNNATRLPRYVPITAAGGEGVIIVNLSNPRMGVGCSPRLSSKTYDWWLLYHGKKQCIRLTCYLGSHMAMETREAKSQYTSNKVNVSSTSHNEKSMQNIRPQARSPHNLPCAAFKAVHKSSSYNFAAFSSICIKGCGMPLYLRRVTFPPPCTTFLP